MGPIQAPPSFSGFSNEPKQSESWLLVSKNGALSLEKKEGLGFFRIYQRMLGHCYDLDRNARLFLSSISQKNENPEELLQWAHSCHFVQKILTHAHKKNHKSNLKLLSINLKERSITLLQDYIASSKQCKLVAACECKMFSTALSLIENGASIDDAKEYLDPLLECAYRKSKWQLCLNLISHGATVKSQVAQSLLLQEAAKVGHKDAASKLLKSGARVNSSDSKANTPLHFACQRLDFEMTKLLIEHGADVSALDEAKKTPLQLPLTSSKRNRFYELVFPHAHKKIDDLIKEAKHSPKSLIAGYKDGCALEIAFLLNDVDMAKSLSMHYSRENFASALTLLKSKYPNSSLNLILFSHLQIQKDHLQKPVPELEITTPNEPVELDELVSLVHQIDHRKINKNGFTSKAYVQNQLQTIVDRIKTRAEFLGTPRKNSPAIEQFYLTIENALKNILLHFKNSVNPIDDSRLKIKLIKELYSIVSLCGGRYFTSITMLFHEICKKTSLSFEDKIHLALAEYRLSIALSIIDPQKKHSVNEYNGFIRMNGKSLGIPGAKAMDAYNDPYGYSNSFTNERLFFELYTPENIQTWIQLLLKDDGALREEYIDWQKASLPEGATEDEKHDYIASKVYTQDGTLDPFAISLFLCKLGIFSSQLTCA